MKGEHGDADLFRGGEEGRCLRAGATQTYSEVAKKGDVYVLECTCGFSTVMGSNMAAMNEQEAHREKHRLENAAIFESAAAERDAARAALNDERERVCALENARARGATPDHYEQSQDCRERGSGIAATTPDNSAYFDERDLLCDDEGPTR